MKQGDIVKLKPGRELRQAELFWRHPKGNIPEAFTLLADAQYQRIGCAGEVDLVVIFEEFGKNYEFEAKHFEVVLPSGEPNLSELLTVEAEATV